VAHLERWAKNSESRGDAHIEKKDSSASLAAGCSELREALAGGCCDATIERLAA
jgi:hypothetical protein